MLATLLLPSFLFFGCNGTPKKVITSVVTFLNNVANTFFGVLGLKYLPALGT